jgi:hypothetical protein
VSRVHVWVSSAAHAGVNCKLQTVPQDPLGVDHSSSTEGQGY